jgi:hypothetical protein
MTRPTKTDLTKKKHKQHHVWQEYLRAWSVDGPLYCLMDGKIFATGTPRIAFERDFYKIGKLTAADIALVRFLLIDVENIDPLTQQLHEWFLGGIAPLGLFEGVTPALEDLNDTYRTNVLENVHMAIEGAFLPLLKRALNKDISFYSDEKSRIILLDFLASQHMRTKGIKERTIEILKEKDNIDASRVWDIMSQMMATSVGLSIYREKKTRQLALVENLTDVAFIAGDQPVINLHAVVGRKKSPATLSWYYPISPRLALLLPEVDEKPIISTASLTLAQVHDLNVRMAAASHRQLFAQSQSALEPYAKAKSQRRRDSDI